MAGTSNDLGQEFEFVKSMQDIDLLSDFQVETTASNSGANNSNVILDQNQANQLAIVGEDGEQTGHMVHDGQEIHMILGDDGQGYHQNEHHREPTQAELHDRVIDALTGDDIVFDNVSNEVSIPAGISTTAVVVDSQGGDQRQGITIKSVSPKKTKTVQINRMTKPITAIHQQPQPQPQPQVMIPVYNQAAGAGLAQFITSIRPPALPGAATIKPKPMPIKSTTATPTVQALTPMVRKPTTIAPAPGNIVKYIMTQTGQQLLISSPLKNQDGSTPKVIHASSSGATTMTTSTGQQVVFLSPIKGGTPQKLVQVRPKPTLAPAQAVRVVTSSVGFTHQIGSSSGLRTMDQKPVQIIKVVSMPGGTGSVTTATVAGLNKANLRPIAPNTPRTIPVSIATSIASALSSGQKVIIPSSSIKGGNIIQATSLATSNSTGGAFMTTGPGGQQVIMLPANLLHGGGTQAIKLNQIPQQFKTVAFGTQVTSAIGAATRTNFVPIAPSPMSIQATTPSAKDVLAGLSSAKVSQNGRQAALDDANRQRKPCNCTKSQCLKLYCDCFANGEFCNACNCNNCFNNLEHEEERQKAIKQCLERNPHAFHPKIGKGRGSGDVTERRHTKGCNCRRSGCLKNYCECYEAKILCSELCKCCGCKNYEDSFERKTLMHLADAAEVRSAQQTAATKTKWWGSDFVPKLPISVGGDNRLHCAFITPEVIDAACQCLLATAENGEKRKLPYEETEKMIIEEFGRCLVQIIDCANKTKNSKTDML